MSKFYCEPIIEIRKYRLTDSVFTDSDPGLHDGDDYELDSIDDSNSDVDSIFVD